MKIGYARVSTDDQNPALQITALKREGCKRIFTDKISGTIRKRPELERCLQSLTQGDVLVVWKLDRLGRSLRDLITLLDDLKGQGEENNTSSPSVRPVPAKAPRLLFPRCLNIPQAVLSLIPKAKTHQSQRDGGANWGKRCSSSIPFLMIYPKATACLVMGLIRW